MAPITCKVADPNAIPIQGIYAILECKDQCGNSFAKYESFSDDGGNIHYWFDFTPMGEEARELIPRIVDILHSPRVTLTFLPGLKASYFPWLSIQTDVHLSEEGSHEFILLLHANSASYHLEHAVFTALPPANTEMDWERTPEAHGVVDLDMGPPRSPSPLQLPSPVIKPRGRSARKKRDGKRGDTDYRP
ncbi:hypothetical protein ACJZ2D_016763 [Fusarium nematophilum]